MLEDLVTTKKFIYKVGVSSQETPLFLRIECQLLINSQ